MNNLRAAIAMICSSVLGPLLARADSTNLIPVADTTLLESYPTNNLGAYSPIIVGTTPRGRARALFRFDLSPIPPNATVSSVTFTINVVNKRLDGIGSNFTLHRVLKDWGEGSAQVNIGDTATDGAASWTNRITPLLPWTPSGGGADVDYANVGSSTVFIDELRSYTFNSTPTLVADVQAWLDNSGTNFGWMLITESEGVVYTARRITAREDPFAPPTLTVQYSTGSQPPPAIPPTISQVALAGNQIRFSFNVESNRTCAVEFRSAVGTGTWGTLTNIPAQPAPATIIVADTVASPGRFYRVRTP
jgi:hypothetical protein